MPDLIALDLDQDDSLVPIIEEIWAAGDALCTLDPRWSPSLRSQALATMAPTVLLDGDGRHNLPEGRKVDSGIGLVMMTSGSMSDPKAVELDHAALQASATITSRRLEVNPTLDHWLCCLPIVHIGGFSVLSRALLTGHQSATIIIGHDTLIGSTSGVSDIVIAKMKWLTETLELPITTMSPIKAYPIPTNGILNISLGGGNLTALNMYDATGKKVYSKTTNFIESSLIVLLSFKGSNKFIQDQIENRPFIYLAMWGQENQFFTTVLQ